MKKVFLVMIGFSVLFMGCRSDTKSQPENAKVSVNGSDTTITFDGVKVGKLPSQWLAETGVWQTAADGSNIVLKMVRNEGSPFNISVIKDLYYKNLEIEARIKGITGNEDQGGGLVWRYIDKNNYYIIRANPLENNIRLYKVVDGRRKQIESKDIDIQTGEWFNIKVVMTNDQIECFYNGNQVFSSSDDTFSKAGLIGIWSKADAVSLFDDLKIKVLDDSNFTPISFNKLRVMKPQKKKVIFVCEHGAGKSVVAAAFFNKIAADRGLNWEASCRGTDPDDEVSPATKEGLLSDGLLDPKLSPQKLTLGDTSNVERIILFTKLPDEFKTAIKREDWSSLPNIDAKYEVRRDALVEKINQFFDSLEKQK